MLESADVSNDVLAIASIDAVPLILDMVKHATGMRFAAVARVTEEKWVACAVDDSIDFGLLPGGELILESTICHEIRQHRTPVIFNHASAHPIYSEHHTPKTYKLESYVSIPIVRSNGDFFGTLCAIDSVPASFDEAAVLKSLGLYAQLISMHLDLHYGLAQTESALADATETGRLREQFIAVLGHDLRTPLSAVRMSADLLETRVNDTRALTLIRAIRQSSSRMGTLIENVLDFARGKLGGGIPIKALISDDLESQLLAVIQEIRVSNPNAPIEAFVDIPDGVHCDPIRLGQLLSNLLNNAVTHGAKESPIRVNISTVEGNLVLSVSNLGAPIPPNLIPLLFQPFSRSEAGQRGEGLGLGLYIAHQICTAHKGSLDVMSTAQTGTSFVATIPSQLKWV